MTVQHALSERYIHLQGEPNITVVTILPNNATIDKLLSIRFSAMANAFRLQQDDPSIKGLDLEELFDYW